MTICLSSIFCGGWLYKICFVFLWNVILCTKYFFCGGHQFHNGKAGNYGSVKDIIKAWHGSGKHFHTEMS